MPVVQAGGCTLCYVLQIGAALSRMLLCNALPKFQVCDGVYSARKMIIHSPDSLFKDKCTWLPFVLGISFPKEPVPMEKYRFLSETVLWTGMLCYAEAPCLFFHAGTFWRIDTVIQCQRGVFFCSAIEAGIYILAHGIWCSFDQFQIMFTVTSGLFRESPNCWGTCTAGCSGTEL